MRQAGRLALHLALVLVGVHLVTVALVVAFAPRLLLLEAAVVESTVGLPLAWSAVESVLLAAGTFVLTRPVTPTLRALATASTAVEPTQVLALASLPRRLTVFFGATSAVLVVATLLPPIRPPANDAFTQISLVLLALTMSSAALLPAYVTLRSLIARVQELVPPPVAAEACALLEIERPEGGRVRGRLLAAVAGPVAFVALGASLLVYAHTRAFDTMSREEDALLMARAMLSPLAGGDVAGRREVIEEAALHGFRIELDRRTGATTTVHSDEGETQMSVPLEPAEGGNVLVRFDTARLPPVTAMYVLLAIAATALAALLGSRIGAAFDADIAIATREVRATGVADVVRGTRMLGTVRFTVVERLMHAIDDLGGVFREFAAAQRSAIHVREAAERMRGLFLASMSHDLRSPLNAILGFAELVKRRPLSPGQRESLQIVEQRGRELLLLIQTILDSARVEAGELDVAPDWTKVDDVVMGAALDARDLVVGSRIQITGEVQGGIPLLLVDGTRIVQALTAFIMSAVRFTEKGRVTVRAMLQADRDRVSIEVESPGEGLAKEEREKLFEAFRNVELARRHGSLGLGLALARSIVEIHGGSVDVEVRAGGGTVFRMSLPTRNDKMSIRSRAAMRPI